MLETFGSEDDILSLATSDGMSSTPEQPPPKHYSTTKVISYLRRLFDTNAKQDPIEDSRVFCQRRD